MSENQASPQRQQINEVIQQDPKIGNQIANKINFVEQEDDEAWEIEKNKKIIFNNQIEEEEEDKLIFAVKSSLQKNALQEKDCEEEQIQDKNNKLLKNSEKSKRQQNFHNPKVKKQKIDPRLIPLKNVLDICVEKKIGDSNLNYRLYPGLLGNEYEFILSFLSHTLSDKNFKNCLIVPLDHRLLTTILFFYFPKDFKSEEDTLQFNFSCKQLNNFYQNMYGMDELSYYKYFLEIEMKYKRKSIKRIRMKYDEVMEKKVKWSNFPIIRKQIQKIQQQILKNQTTQELQSQLQQQLEFIRKRRREEVQQINHRLGNSYADEKKRGSNIQKGQKKQKIKEQSQYCQEIQQPVKRKRVQVINQRDRKRRRCYQQSLSSSSLSQYNKNFSSSNSLSGSQIYRKRSKSISISSNSVVSVMSETPQRLKNINYDSRSISDSLQSGQEDSQIAQIISIGDKKQSDGSLEEGDKLYEQQYKDHENQQSQKLSSFSEKSEK